MTLWVFSAPYGCLSRHSFRQVVGKVWAGFSAPSLPRGNACPKASTRPVERPGIRAKIGSKHLLLWCPGPFLPEGVPRAVLGARDSHYEELRSTSRRAGGSHRPFPRPSISFRVGAFANDWDPSNILAPATSGREVVSSRRVNDSWHRAGRQLR